MFSTRTEWNSAPNQLSVLLAEKQLRGESIIDLTESNPTKCEFLYPREEILSALSDESVLSYRPEPRGLLSARTAITKYYAKICRSIAPENIVLTSSTSEAYSFLFKLLCDVNDEVIVPQPGYPLFEYLHQLNDITLRHYQLLYDGEWHIDFTSLTNAITNKTRAIVLVHPNNPTGSFLKQDDFERIRSLAAERHFAIIVDEVFTSYAFSPDARRANIFVSHSDVPLFFLNGISKLLGLPQLKLSWIIVDNKPDQRIEILNRLDIIADTFLSVNIPVQIALSKLLKHSSNIEEQIRKRVQMNYQLAQNIFAGSSISVLNVEGGWYAILKLPRTHSDDDWAADILTQQNVLVYPGHFFEIEQKNCVVVSLLPLSELFRDALSRIRQLTNEIF